MGRNGSTVQPATRRGGPTPDEPTVQDCMLLSAVKAASEDEKSPFENPVLQQYQQAMMMHLQAQMALGGLITSTLPNSGPANLLLPNLLKPPLSISNASSQPDQAQRQLSGSLMDAGRKASKPATGRRAYSTPVINKSEMDGFSPATMDEEELKKRRRKESNRESARRSRLKRQAECDKLQEEIQALREETLLLRKENKDLRDLVAALQGPSQP